MSEQRRWTTSLVAGTSLVGLTITSSIAVLAHYFVNEFSRPHATIPDIPLTWKLPLSSGEPPLELQRSLIFKAVDGTLLRGDFWAQPQPAPTIILCHGYRISRSFLRPVAELEYSSGYNVLSFDFRGHGESDSVLTSAGNAEVRDLEAALFAASKQPETLAGKMIIHGFSMGAAVALLTPPHPDLAAIIADSPYARSDEVMRCLIEYRLDMLGRKYNLPTKLLKFLVPVLAWITVLLSTLDFRIRYGYSVVARPEHSFRRWRKQMRLAMQKQEVPILLIHAQGDTLVPIRHAQQLVKAAKAHGIVLDTYLTALGGHCGSYAFDPMQYQTVIQRFLAQHLGKDLPTRHT